MQCESSPFHSPGFRAAEKYLRCLAFLAFVPALDLFCTIDSIPSHQVELTDIPRQPCPALCASSGSQLRSRQACRKPTPSALSVFLAEAAIAIWRCPPKFCSPEFTDDPVTTALEIQGVRVQAHQDEKLNSSELLLRAPDAVMEPHVLAVLKRYVKEDGGKPITAVEGLSDSFAGDAANALPAVQLFSFAAGAATKCMVLLVTCWLACCRLCTYGQPGLQMAAADRESLSNSWCC